MSTENSTKHGYNDLDIALPRTATKPVIVPKKRGRKGNKLALAFKEIPAEPVDFNKYAKAHDVSTKSLRQIKRHDPYKETGKVFVNKDTNKDSETFGTMRIWRDINQKPQ